MINFIGRLFAHWHKIPKEKVPKWVRGKLYKQKYIKNEQREYRKIIERKSKVISIPDGLSHETGEQLFYDKSKTWKDVKYYYRKLK